MLNYDYITKENIEKQNPSWPRIFHHRILITGGAGYSKTNVILNLIKQQNDDDYIIIDKIYLYV